MELLDTWKNDGSTYKPIHKYSVRSIISNEDGVTRVLLAHCAPDRLKRTEYLTVGNQHLVIETSDTLSVGHTAQGITVIMKHRFFRHPCNVQKERSRPMNLQVLENWPCPYRVEAWSKSHGGHGISEWSHPTMDKNRLYYANGEGAVFPCNTTEYYKVFNIWLNLLHKLSAVNCCATPGI